MAAKKKAPTDKQWDLIVRNTLRHEEYRVLTMCAYDLPMTIPVDSAYRRSAMKLVQLGLLERNPTARHEFRCTDRGEDLRIRFSR